MASGTPPRPGGPRGPVEAPGPAPRERGAAHTPLGPRTRAALRSGREVVSAPPEHIRPVGRASTWTSVSAWPRQAGASRRCARARTTYARRGRCPRGLPMSACRRRVCGGPCGGLSRPTVPGRPRWGSRVPQRGRRDERTMEGRCKQGCARAGPRGRSGSRSEERCRSMLVDGSG